MRPDLPGPGPTTNPPNRYEPVHVELDADPDVDVERDTRETPTLFYRDASRTVLATNDSPDVGFKFSLNPYRGCEHGCAYCVDPSTPILLADGATKPIAELVVGDEIYGTERRGWYRRYVKTRVLAHWETQKQCYR